MSSRKEKWYINPNKKLTEAYELLLSLESMKKGEDSVFNKEFKTFNSESIVRFIYESNTIEKEGAGWHETKELLIQPAQKIPFSLKALKDFSLEPCVWLPTLKDPQKQIDKTPRLILKHRGLRREAEMVAQHYNAYVLSMASALRFLYTYIKRGHWELLKDDDYRAKMSKEERKFVSRLFKDGVPNTKPRIFNPFSQRNIKMIHKVIAKGFIAEDLGHAGSYRKKPIMIDPYSNFPDPELVPKCMKIFSRRALRCLMGSGDPIRKAAIISGEFVLIHPFGDFNGRVSRLIMNMALMCFGFYLPISIRADKKSRHRYFYSLKLAASGNFMHLSCAISIEFVEMINRLNKILIKAGLDPISPTKVPDSLISTIDDPLEY